MMPGSPEAASSEPAATPGEPHAADPSLPDWRSANRRSGSRGGRRDSRVSSPDCRGARRTTVRRSKQAGENKDPWQAPDPALAVAMQQLKWFARHRNRARVTYQVNEILILLTTATTTVTAALKVSAAATAILAASTVVLAGLYKVVDSHA